MSSIMKFDASGLGITATGIHIMPPRAAFGAAAAGASVAMVLRCVWVALVNRFEDANAPGSNAHRLWHRGMCSRSFNTTSSPLSSCAVAASTSGGNFSSTRVRARTSSGQCAGSPHWKLWQAHRVTQPVQQNRWVRVELVVPFGALACALGTSALLDLFGVLLPKSAMAQPSCTGYSITLQLVLRHACCDMRRAQSNSTNLLVVGPTPPWETGSASKGLTQSPKVASPTPRLGCCASRFNQIAAVTQDAGECARPDIVGAPECSGGSRGCWCSLVLLAAALVECFNQCAPQLDPRIHRWMVLPRRSTILPGQEHNTTVRERQTRQPNATAL